MAALKPQLWLPWVRETPSNGGRAAHRRHFDVALLRGPSVSLAGSSVQTGNGLKAGAHELPCTAGLPPFGRYAAAVTSGSITPTEPAKLSRHGGQWQDQEWRRVSHDMSDDIRPKVAAP